MIEPDLDGTLRCANPAKRLDRFLQIMIVERMPQRLEPAGTLRGKEIGRVKALLFTDRVEELRPGWVAQCLSCELLERTVHVAGDLLRSHS